MRIIARGTPPSREVKFRCESCKTRFAVDDWKPERIVEPGKPVLLAYDCPVCGDTCLKEA